MYRHFLAASDTGEVHAGSRLRLARPLIAFPYGGCLSHRRPSSRRAWALASAWSWTYNYSFKPKPLRGSA